MHQQRIPYTTTALFFFFFGKGSVVVGLWLWNPLILPPHPEVANLMDLRIGLVELGTDMGMIPSENVAPSYTMWYLLYINDDLMFCSQ